MNAFVKGCDDLRQEYFPGGTIVVVRHTGKDVKRRARSSIALLGAADVECSVTKTSHGVIQLENTRQKDDAEQPYDGAVKVSAKATSSAQPTRNKWQRRRLPKGIEEEREEPSDGVLDAR